MFFAGRILYTPDKLILSYKGLQTGIFNTSKNPRLNFSFQTGRSFTELQMFRAY